MHSSKTASRFHISKQTKRMIISSQAYLDEREFTIIRTLIRPFPKKGMLNLMRYPSEVKPILNTITAEHKISRPILSVIRIWQKIKSELQSTGWRDSSLERIRPQQLLTRARFAAAPMIDPVSGTAAEQASFFQPFLTILSPLTLFCFTKKSIANVLTMPFPARG
jgi:hypothetical protein